MLVITRKVGESVWIGDDICVTLIDMGGGRARLGIKAPRQLTVLRQELRRDKGDDVENQSKEEGPE